MSLRKAFLILIFLIGHHEKYDRVDFISIDDGEILIEVLDITFPYENSYDSKKIKIDRDRNGYISDEELKKAGDEDGIFQLMKISLKVNDRPILLKRLKSEVRECPREILKNTPISIWHRFYGRTEGNLCGNITFSDNGDFKRGIVKLIINKNCPIKETDGIKKENYVIKEIGEKERMFNVILEK